MLLSIDLKSETPIYTQIVHQIIEGIARRQLTPGEALPSVRALASDLGINLHTVNKAYQQLRQEGFIDIHRQKGAMISRDPLPEVDDAFVAVLQDQLRPLIANAICRKMNAEQFISLCQNIYEQFNPKQQDDN